MTQYIDRQDILELPLRSDMYHLIQKRGGITFTEIKKELDRNNGVTAYQLNILQKNHLIRSFKDGKYVRFFAKGQKVSGLTTIEEILMNEIKSNPYISRLSLVKLVDYSQGTVNSTIKKLRQKELIGMKKIGKHYAYYSIDTSIDPTSSNTIDHRVSQDF